MEDLIPIVMFAVIGLVLCTYLLLRYFARRELQRTLRAAIERGQELSPEVLQTLSGEPASGAGDLRKGVIWLALAAALGLFSLAAGEPDLLGPAAFPLMLGLAYLVLWRFGPGRAG